jgi:hypothetical protein
MRRLALCLAVLAMGSVRAAPQNTPVEFPLDPGTRWVYHLHQENGPGVTFSDLLSPAAKGNVIDISVVAAVAGTEVLAGHTYTRIETTFNGKPFLEEWARVAADGLVYGQTIDYQQSPDPIVMQPEQRRVSSNVRPGSFWYWSAPDGSMRIRYNVVGPAEVEVPAGRYQSTHYTDDSTFAGGAGASALSVHQDTWFVPRVGIVQQQTHVTLQSRELSQITLTLEQFASTATP